MSVKSVLNRCREALMMSADQHRYQDDPCHAAMCDLQADAVLRLLLDLDNERTTDGREIPEGDE